MIGNHNDACKILGIAPNADVNEWKRAYRNILKRYHPDNNDGKLDEEYYLAGEAYAFLEREYEYYLKTYCQNKAENNLPGNNSPFRNKIIGGSDKYKYNHSDYQKKQQKYNSEQVKKKQAAREELERKSKEIREHEEQEKKLSKEQILEQIGWIRIAGIIHETIENDKKNKMNNKQDWNE